MAPPYSPQNPRWSHSELGELIYKAMAQAEDFLGDNFNEVQKIWGGRLMADLYSAVNIGQAPPSIPKIFALPGPNAKQLFTMMEVLSRQTMAELKSEEKNRMTGNGVMKQAKEQTFAMQENAILQQQMRVEAANLAPKILFQVGHCMICGATNHHMSLCPRTTCYICHKPGHMGYRCSLISGGFPAQPGGNFFSPILQYGFPDSTGTTSTALGAPLDPTKSQAYGNHFISTPHPVFSRPNAHSRKNTQSPTKKITGALKTPDHSSRYGGLSPPERKQSLQEESFESISTSPQSKKDKKLEELEAENYLPRVRRDAVNNYTNDKAEKDLGRQVNAESTDNLPNSRSIQTLTPLTLKSQSESAAQAGSHSTAKTSPKGTDTQEKVTAEKLANFSKDSNSVSKQDQKVKQAEVKSPLTPENGKRTSSLNPAVPPFTPTRPQRTVQPNKPLPKIEDSSNLSKKVEPISGHSVAVLSVSPSPVPQKNTVPYASTNEELIIQGGNKNEEHIMSLKTHDENKENKRAVHESDVEDVRLRETEKEQTQQEEAVAVKEKIEEEAVMSWTADEIDQLASIGQMSNTVGLKPAEPVFLDTVGPDSVSPSAQMSTLDIMASDPVVLTDHVKTDAWNFPSKPIANDSLPEFAIQNSGFDSMARNKTWKARKYALIDKDCLIAKNEHAAIEENNKDSPLDQLEQQILEDSAKAHMFPKHEVSRNEYVAKQQEIEGAEAFRRAFGSIGIGGRSKPRPAVPITSSKNVSQSQPALSSTIELPLDGRKILLNPSNSSNTPLKSAPPMEDTVKAIKELLATEKGDENANPRKGSHGDSKLESKESASKVVNLVSENKNLDLDEDDLIAWD